MYGWITCDFTVFLSYQDAGRVIMKGFVNWNLVLRWKRFPPQAWLKSGTARSVGQRSAHKATGAPLSDRVIFDKRDNPS